MSEALYRAFRPELEVRSRGDGRTVHGIAVPYNAPMRINDTLVELFEPGAFAEQIRMDGGRRVKFAREHLALGGQLIGSMQRMQETPNGLYVELRAAKTPVGDETLELIKDGALSHLSIGFHERQHRMAAGGVTARTKAYLFEVASVLEGAYGDLAAAAGVRSAAMAPDDLYQRTGDAGREGFELRTRAEAILAAGLPELPDRELEIRAALLGMPMRP